MLKPKFDLGDEVILKNDMRLSHGAITECKIHEEDEDEEDSYESIEYCVLWSHGSTSWEYEEKLRPTGKNFSELKAVMKELERDQNGIFHRGDIVEFGEDGYYHTIGIVTKAAFEPHDGSTVISVCVIFEDGDFKKFVGEACKHLRKIGQLDKSVTVPFDIKEILAAANKNNLMYMMNNPDSYEKFKEDTEDKNQDAGLFDDTIRGTVHDEVD